MSEEPRVELDAALVRGLVESQFPEWADLPITPVVPGGWDNRTFRLGSTMSVRLPSHERYVAQVEKEQEWLPVLAERLPLPIPAPIAMGQPGIGYPWPWSVYRWLDGETAATVPAFDHHRVAAALADFLAALHRVDAEGGPPAGLHNFFRGGSLSVYDDETRDAIRTLEDRLDVGPLRSVWDAALETEWAEAPVWVHGDVAPSNFLLVDGELAAVIDFGCCGVGDPACDLTIAWTLFSGSSRDAFRAGLPLNAATWRRARGWALWKAVISLVNGPDGEAQRIVDAVVAEHEAEEGRGP